MPRFNGTGPAGFGPGTGRGMGPCAVPAGRPGGGMGYGRQGYGRRGGFGWRRFWGYYPAPDLPKKEETEILSEEAKILEDELKAVRLRLAELKGKKQQS
jgi:hypothetical protein